MTRVLLVDGSQVILKIASEMLSQHSDIQVIKAVSTLPDALRVIKEFIPDVTVMDLSMADRGVESTRQGRTLVEHSRTVVCMSMLQENDTKHLASVLGVTRCVDKMDLYNELPKAIREVGLAV